MIKLFKKETFAWIGRNQDLWKLIFYRQDLLSSREAAVTATSAVEASARRPARTSARADMSAATE